MKFAGIEKLVALYSRASKRERIIMIAAGVFVSMWISDQAVIGPLVATFGNMDREAKDLKTSIRRSVQLLSQKERMMKEVEQYADYSIETKSPDEEALSLLKHIEELANNTSINLLYVKPAGANPGEVIQKYYVTLEGEGQMQQLVQFFYAIENSKLLLRVEKYVLQPTETGSSVIKCSATVSRAIIP